MKKEEEKDWAKENKKTDRYEQTVTVVKQGGGRKSSQLS
jgi:hypothetical protein